jgi:hypothetical protein
MFTQPLIFGECKQGHAAIGILDQILAYDAAVLLIQNFSDPAFGGDIHAGVILPLHGKGCNISAMPFVADDPVNRSIWTESVALQRRIAVQTSCPLIVGAQQAMPKVCHQNTFSAQSPLPWVPDLVGRRFGDDLCSVLVVASSYNGFIEGYSLRDAAMPVHEYVNASNDHEHGLEEFCRSYFENVVLGEEAYYQPILRDLLQGACIDLDCCCLTDLCKASFVQRGTGPDNGNRGDVGSDKIIKNSWPKWLPYVTGLVDDSSKVPLPYEWLWERMQKCVVIIPLGTIAEYGVLKIFQHMASAPTVQSCHDRVVPDHPTMNSSLANWEYGYVCTRRKLGSWLKETDWWEMSDSGRQPRWFMLPVYHPSYAVGRRGDIGYRETSARVQRMMKEATQLLV